ncbi:hypothetical protein TWF481_001949 [Arthrobotrys musiformis]|uniref:C2H2-type domain-containing protein n=1 Tax=Arthrobotrys musiformis TaxID=47236 RepID=A0AAV9VUT5_9PEZI
MELSNTTRASALALGQIPTNGIEPNVFLPPSTQSEPWKFMAIPPPGETPFLSYHSASSLRGFNPLMPDEYNIAAGPETNFASGMAISDFATRSLVNPSIIQRPQNTQLPMPVPIIDTPPTSRRSSTILPVTRPPAQLPMSIPSTSAVNNLPVTVSQHSNPQPLLPTPVPNTPTAPGREFGTRSSNSIDLNSFRRLPLAEQRLKLQNPGVGKLDLGDQIDLYAILVETLKLEYRLNTEELGLNLSPEPTGFGKGFEGLADSTDDDEFQVAAGERFVGESGLGWRAAMKPTKKKNEELTRKSIAGEASLVSQSGARPSASSGIQDKAHRQFFCAFETCEKSFTRPADRRRHRKQVHKIDDDKVSGPGPDRTARGRYSNTEPGSGRLQIPFPRKDNPKQHKFSGRDVDIQTSEVSGNYVLPGEVHLPHTEASFDPSGVNLNGMPSDTRGYEELDNDSLSSVNIHRQLHKAGMGGLTRMSSASSCKPHHQGDGTMLGPSFGMAKRFMPANGVTSLDGLIHATPLAPQSGASVTEPRLELGNEDITTSM